MALLRLAELRWPEADRVRDEPGAVGIIGVGALEQHGPHLPMIMDTAHVEALAEEVARRLPVTTVVPPPVWFGLSGHHLAFPGTVTVSEELLEGVIVAIAEALVRSHVRRIVLISGHGGNFAFIGEVAERLSAGPLGVEAIAYSDLMVFAGRMFEAARGLGLDPPPTDLHAGLLETSVALTLFDRELIGDFDDVEGYTAAEDGWLQTLLTDGMETLSPSGVLGAPAGATAQAGRAIFAALAEGIAEHVADAFCLDLAGAAPTNDTGGAR